MHASIGVDLRSKVYRLELFEGLKYMHALGLT